MYTYIVKSADKITDSTLLLDLEQKTSGRSFEYQAGQYAAISFLRKGRPTPARCFSIVSSPTDEKKLQFGMRVNGRFTKAAANLKPGAIVKVRGAFGGFVLGIATSDDLVFLAGGVGITPFMSMLSYAATIQSPKKITLIYSCQSQDDIPFLAKLVTLQQQNPNFKATFVIGNGAVDRLNNVSTVQGRLTPEVMNSLLGGVYADRTFYTCGSSPYMSAMVKSLRSKGVSKNQIMTEAFAQGVQMQTGKIRSWPYNVYALSAAGLILGSLAVTISDMLKTLPPQSLIGSTNLAPTLLSSNSRQRDLDSLVNALPALSASAPATPAAQASINAAAAAAVASSAVSIPAATTTSVVQAAPAPAPAPAPVQKTCTTTQSGVTTCI